MDAPDRAPSDQPTLEGVPNEADASIEEGIPSRGLSNVDKIEEKAPSRVVAASMLLPRLVDTKSSKKMMPDQLLLSMYVLP